MAEDFPPVRHVEVIGRIRPELLRRVDGVLCVSLRAELGSFDTDELRLRGLLAAQRELGRPLPLVTARGSIASHPPTVRRWVDEHPALRLCLDLRDWTFGCEVLLGRSDEWRSLVRHLAPRVDVLVPSLGGSERSAATRSGTAPLLARLSRRRFGSLRSMGLAPNVRVVQALPQQTVA